MIADHADLLRADTYAEEGSYAEAAVTALLALQSYGTSPLRGDLYRVLGDARASFGDLGVPPVLPSKAPNATPTEPPEIFTVLPLWAAKDLPTEPPEIVTVLPSKASKSLPPIIPDMAANKAATTTPARVA